MLVGGVIQHQLGNHAQPAPVGLAQKTLKVFQRAVRGMDVGVIGDVVAVVAQRRGAEGQEPNGGYAEVLQVIELLGQAAEIADAVGDAVEEGAHVHFVNDGVFVPGDIGRKIHDLLLTE